MGPDADEQGGDADAARRVRGLRILMLSWEYPPVVHGGLGRHVAALAAALGGLGHEVTVVAPGAARPTTDRPGAATPPSGASRCCTPTRPIRWSPLSVGDLHGHVATLGAALARTAPRRPARPPPGAAPATTWCARTTGWSAQAAVTVAAGLRLPLVATVHATEAGRHQGWLPGELSRSIHATEGWLTAAATRTVVCSEAMRRDVTRLFGLPDERVDVVAERRRPGPVGAGPRPRGSASRWSCSPAGSSTRRACRSSCGPCPASADGSRACRWSSPAAGPTRRSCVRSPRSCGCPGPSGSPAAWTTPAWPSCYRAAAVVAVPSLYEPFGLVALEAAACGAPLVLAETGGLAEFADGGRTARTVPPDDVALLADAVSGLLLDRETADKYATAAREAVDTHCWRSVATRTAAVYARAAARPRGAGPLRRCRRGTRTCCADRRAVSSASSGRAAWRCCWAAAARIISGVRNVHSRG